MNKCCGNCKYWSKFTAYELIANFGTCSKIGSKIEANVEYGMDGGYVEGFESEEDFCCSLYEDKGGC